MSNLLFTYGTLHPNFAPGEIASAIRQLRLVGNGYVCGTLYDLGEYPGAILNPISEQRIFGTVFQWPLDADVLSKLDYYEGFNPLAPEKSLFRRTLHPVRLAAGRTLQCWIYVYNRIPEPARVVVSGTFQRRQPVINFRTERPS